MISPEIDWGDALKTPPLSLYGARQSALLGAPRPSDVGESFNELTPLREGADLKRVQWSRWITRGELVTRSFDDPRRGHLCLFFDETGSMRSGDQWMLSRQLGARLALGALSAGHIVTLWVERAAALEMSPPLKRPEELIAWWPRLITEPEGLGAPLELRQRYLSGLDRSTRLVYLSDGVSVIAPYAHRAQASDAAKPPHHPHRSTHQLITSADQLSGALGRLELTLYLCLTDDQASLHALSDALRSPELTRSSALQLTSDEERERALTKLQDHLTEQSALVRRAYKSAWLTCDRSTPLDQHLRQASRWLCAQ